MYCVFLLFWKKQVDNLTLILQHEPIFFNYLPKHKPELLYEVYCIVFGLTQTTAAD